jgi:hypothetical protein
VSPQKLRTSHTDIAWVIFRADTLGHAASMLKAMAGFGAGTLSEAMTPLPASIQ